MNRYLVTVVLVAAAITDVAAQGKKTPDISTVASAGAIADGKYTNSFFRLAVAAPNARLDLNPLVNKEGGGARLVQVMAKQTAFDNTYTFAVLADTLAKYPRLQSATQYVRSVRHQLERESLSTVREEFPITISGVDFTGAILEEHVPEGRKYYRGMYSTFRDGFVLSFDVEAASPEKVNELVVRAVSISNPPKLVKNQ
jgi:hypothetical protein